jgi:hypothetical protein
MGLSFAVFFIVGKYRMDVSTLSATPEKPIGASVIATTTATTVKPTSAAASLKLKTLGK